MLKKQHFSFGGFTMSKKLVVTIMAFSLVALLAVTATTAPQKTNGYTEAADTYGAVASARVDKLNGNQNGLTITVMVDDVIAAEAYYLIKNNSAGEFVVGNYKVYVSTYGNDKIDYCFITYANITITPGATVGGDEIVISATGLLEGYSQFDLSVIIGGGPGPFTYALWFVDGGTVTFSKDVTLSYQGSTFLEVAAGETLEIDASSSEFSLPLDDGNSIIFIAKSSPGNFSSLPPDLPFSGFPGTVIGKGIYTPQAQKLTYDFWNPFTEEYEELPYYLFVSSKVTPDVPAPLIVVLHGMGADGKYLMSGRLLELVEEGGYIAVAPLGYDKGFSGWYGSPWMSLPANMSALSEKDVMDVLQLMRDEFVVDSNRIYMMGHSMGGAGTLFLGQKHSSIWAALGPIAPAAFMMTNRVNYLTPILNAGIPVIVVQGDSDAQVPASNTRQWITTMEQLGINHEYIEMEGFDHGSIIGVAMDDIFRFFAENVKNP